jgi:hypothetical protein
VIADQMEITTSPGFACAPPTSTPVRTAPILRVNVQPVRLAFLHDLSIAGHTRTPASSAASRMRSAPAVVRQFESFFKNEARRQIKRLRANIATSFTVPPLPVVHVAAGEKSG